MLFPQRLGIRQEYEVWPLTLNVVLQVTAHTISYRKINERHTDYKGRKHPFSQTAQSSP